MCLEKVCGHTRNTAQLSRNILESDNRDTLQMIITEKIGKETDKAQ